MEKPTQRQEIFASKPTTANGTKVMLAMAYLCNDQPDQPMTTTSSTLRRLMNISKLTETRWAKLLMELENCTIDYDRQTYFDLKITWSMSRPLVAAPHSATFWRHVDLQHVAQMRSKYSMHLYMWLCANMGYHHKQTATIWTQNMRQIVNVPQGKLYGFETLTRAAMRPAIAEIEKITGITVNITKKHVGRSNQVMSVEITWTRTKQNKSSKTKELQNNDK